MKYIISILLLFFPHFFNAQTSKEILSNLSKKTKSYKSVTFDFTSTLKIPKSGSTQINKGSAKITEREMAMCSLMWGLKFSNWEEYHSIK